MPRDDSKYRCDRKPRATNGLLEGDTGHFRRWRVGNKMHHHGALGLLTPYDVHFGVAAKRHAEQEAVLRKTFETMPERFVRGVTNLPALPAGVCPPRS